jgi:dihydrofolate reductase
MRKIILSMMVSVDGFMESKDPAENWGTFDEEMSDYMVDFMKGTDAFIYGRKSYEAMLQYWPQLNGPFADIMNNKPKLIFSKTLKNPEWNATLYNEVESDEILALKKQEGKDIALFAGADIAAAFIRLKLVDEYRLIINPIVLGGGKPLFKAISENLKLKLVTTRAFKCGNVLLCYKNA